MRRLIDLRDAEFEERNDALTELAVALRDADLEDRGEVAQRFDEIVIAYAVAGPFGVNLQSPLEGLGDIWGRLMLERADEIDSSARISMQRLIVSDALPRACIATIVCSLFDSVESQ